MEKKEKVTIERLVSPSLTFGIIMMCVGACGEMSLNARTYHVVFY